jgi:riboflavin kinase / FMN adenylyltransferase
LMDLGQEHDFAVYGVPPIRIDGEVVSSTEIREAVASADLKKAARLLGRPYSLFGRVAEGRKLGGQWGFPTANIAPEAELLPPFGVYAVKVQVDGEWLPGVANLGIRPTVEASAQPALEAHLFDWSGDLYGQDLEVRLEFRIRDERKFAAIEDLRVQIDSDAREARRLLGL